MKCEVKNVQSAEVFQIPPEGMVFGRAGGPANITVSDQSVSKRHARIYLKDGAWVLEDLKSVNGTVVNNRRITEPMALQPGFVFALSKHQFEIVVADGAAGAAAPMGTRSSSPKGVNGNGNGAAVAAEAMGSDPRRSRSSQRPQRPGGPSQPVQVPDAEPLLPPEPRGRQSAPMTDELDQGGAEQDAYLDEAVQGGGAAAVLAALPKAIAYYLAAIPLMALNPLGTIRRGVEEPKLKAMGPLELIAFILPIQLFANVLGAWASGIATLISGGGFAVMSFLPIVGIIVAVVASVIFGVITHPLLKFVIDRLFKGESDDKTRTNYMIMTQTAFGLVMIPTAVTVLLTAVIGRLAATIAPIALLLIIPAVLSAITMPLMPLILWNWMKAFRVLPIIQKICFVLVILSLLGGVATAVMGVVGAVKMMTGGGVTVAGEVKIDGTITDPEEVKKALEAAQKAAEDAKKLGVDPDKKPDDVKPDDVKTPVDVKKPDEVKTQPVEVKKPPDEVKTPDPPEEVRGTAYTSYKGKRDFIEKAIADDPSLLRNEKISRIYKELSKGTYRGIAQAEEDVLGRKKKYDPALKLYLEKYKEMKIYDETKSTVDELYKALKK